MYDIIIIGGGPAGLSAGIYASRAMLKTLIIEKGLPGGQVTTTEQIENYPGSVTPSTGMALGKRMEDQAREFGCEIEMDIVSKIEIEGPVKKVHGMFGVYEAKTLILATGANPKKLGIPGEEDFAGRGIGYCATCDAPFYEGADIYVVGGGDAAVEEGIYLTRFGKKVTIIHRRDELRATKILQKRAFENPKMEFMWDTLVTGVQGDHFLSAIEVQNVKTGDKQVIKADGGGQMGLFILIGYEPNTELVKGLIDLEDGYIRTDELMQTAVPGFFAAGDVRVKRDMQAITSAADGAIAALTAEKYIESLDD